jgi:hypothetical protein
VTRAQGADAWAASCHAATGSDWSKRALLSRLPRFREADASTRPASTPWPNIEAFFEAGEGDISLGGIGYNPTRRHTAVASDENNMLVALVRRPEETLHQLLDRLEQALGPAIEDQIFVDEINGPSSPPAKSIRR